MTTDQGMPRNLGETVPEEDWAGIRALVRNTYGDAARFRGSARPLSHSRLPGGWTNPVGTQCDERLGLGCGNPTALAALQSDETVLDLGSGPGFDCLVAALCVGEGGSVVGIDLTPEMVRLARHNAAEAGVRTVSFLLGEIGRLPLHDEVFDVAISNCVINLCPDKVRVLTEVHRVLRRGGRLAFADVVALEPLPREIAEDLALYAGCVAGAVSADELSAALHAAGFDSVRIVTRKESRQFISAWAPGRALDRFIAAADVTAIKK